MKDIEELNLPADIVYSKNHEWVKKEGDLIKIGISDYARDQLGDIVFVEMPEKGDTFEREEEFGTLESVKAVSEVYLPMGGEITAVNEELEDAPELLNEDPYENWIITVRPVNAGEYDDLLSRDDYLKLLQE